MIKYLETGIAYRNPIPHVKSVHAYFPSAVQLPDGEIVIAMSMGEAFESADQHVAAYRSYDLGETWINMGQIYKSPPKDKTSEYCRISYDVKSNEIIAALMKYNRSRIDCGLGNEKNNGFVETELVIMRSNDKGESWTKRKAVKTPIEGPSFELCCPIVFLEDGRWIFPTSTWRGWDGFCPNGMRAVAFLSKDKGNTWDEYLDVMSDIENSIIFWESKIVQLADKRLLAVAWAYDEKNTCDLPNQYTISDVSGKKFGIVKTTGLIGQTMTPFILDDGRVLSVYRRTDKSGLWANISRIEGNEWINEEELPLWGYDMNGLVANGDNMIKNFNVLRFGAPNIIRLHDGTYFITFWAVENQVSNIRWIKLQCT